MRVCKDDLTHQMPGMPPYSPHLNRRDKIQQTAWNRRADPISTFRCARPQKLAARNKTAEVAEKVIYQARINESRTDGIDAHAGTVQLVLLSSRHREVDDPAQVSRISRCEQYGRVKLTLLCWRSLERLLYQRFKLLQCIVGQALTIREAWHAAHASG